MKKNYLRKIELIFLACMLILSLTYPILTLEYAKAGLQIWYKNMVPALLPMMIITGCMIKLNITASFASVIYPFTKKIYHLSKNGTYAFIIGFLCGFPMGAKVICELYNHDKITENEASFLLPICNNIGPIFMLTYGLQSFQPKYIYFILIIFYIIPMGYAFFLSKKTNFHTFVSHHKSTRGQTTYSMPFSIALDEAISDGAASILSLGGYIIFFSIISLIPLELLSISKSLKAVLACLIEITNGLSYQDNLPPFLIMGLLQFGGICCTFQTIKFTTKTNLKIKNYLLHKINLTLITFIIFFMIFKILS